MKSVKIYTKTGDKGFTSLYGGKRVSKDHLRIESYGTIDELNSFLGIVCLKIEGRREKNDILSIQRDLFSISSHLAGAPVDTSFLEKRIQALELSIDFIQQNIPVLKHFIIPGGNETAVYVFYVRTIARRAERRIVALARLDQVNQEVIRYFNRLSDYLYMLGRFLNHKAGNGELVWKGG